MWDPYRKETVELILEKAVRKENQAYLLYRNASNNTKDVYVKNLLHKLAEREQKHIQAIEDFDKKILKKQKLKIDESSKKRIADYLMDMDEELNEASDIKGVFLYAAKREEKPAYR